jgi:hypothetical protein
MCVAISKGKILNPPLPLVSQSRRTRILTLISFLALLALAVAWSQRRETVLAERAREASAAASVAPNPVGQCPLPGEKPWTDSLGDGFPDSARLERAEDRGNFIRWLTFLAEAQYYTPSRQAREEVQDCSALLRYAYRNALMAHTAEWRRSAGLPYEPGFGDITKFAYPRWPLGSALFRTRAGPLAPLDLERGAFAEFADSATLLRYNTFLVSRDLRAARPGDLLFFHQPTQREPYHTMLFVGDSYFQPQGSDWIVYHTGDLNRKRGEIREVQASLLLEHPDPRWRPLPDNPCFLGIYRLEILR